MDLARIRAGSGVELLRHCLQYAASQGKRLGDTRLTTAPLNDSEAKIFDALKSRGLKLIPQLGASQYRIDRRQLRTHTIAYDHYDLLVHPASDNSSDTGQMIRWARECWKALEPFAERAVYVNALEEGQARVREAHGPNYQKLVNLKNKCDPRNMFRQNSNISNRNPNRLNRSANFSGSEA